MDQDTQTKVYPLKNRGVVTKLDPALLSDGQLFNSVNTVSMIEGEITGRPGRLLLGDMPSTAISPHKICKLSIPNQVVPISNATNASPIVVTTSIPHGWQTNFTVNIQGVTGNTAANGTDQIITVTGPSSFSLPGSVGSGAYVNGGIVTLNSGDPSLRYVGEGGDIWRTNGFFATGSYTKVNPSDVMAGFDPFVTGWAMAPYSAGTTGNPIAYFATPALMLRDQGNSPFAALRSWGITQALAAAKASNTAATPVVINGTSASGTLIEISTASAHGFSTGQTVTITLVTGTTEANGTWTITVVDGTHFILNNSVFVNAWVSGGQALVSGPDSTQPGATPYDYAFTLRDPATGNEGNPSTFMDVSLAVQSQDGAITVTVWGSPDPKITGTQSIVLYRRGGAFADGIFRQVGYLTNPGVNGSGVPNPATFVDTTPDSGLIYAAQAEFDNFPPVVSTLRVPVNTTISSGSPGLAPGWNTLTLGSAIQNILTVGSSLIIGSSSGASTDNQETVVIAALPQSAAAGAPTTCLVYLQLAHAAGEPVQIGSVAGQPCSLAIAAFDCLFVAGDRNNPQTLYQSKTGRPESFPIVDSLGNSHSINVGTPSNGIQNICEFRGKILCLNVSNLFEVDFFQGVMYGPNETPCERGLIAPWAFCKSENVVYYLAYDGIWSWNGSRSQKISEPIDTVFQGGLTIPGAPEFLDRPYISQCRLEYYRNQVFFLYPAVSGLNLIWRYDTLYDRWTEESHYPIELGEKYISTFFLEQDTADFIFGRTDPGGGVFSQYDAFSSTTPGYSDEYTDVGIGINGTPFQCGFWTGYFRPEDFIRIKLFQDFLVELSILSGIVALALYYDYAILPDPIDQFSITGPLGRGSVPLPLQLSGTPALPLGKEAIAVSANFSWSSISVAVFNSIGIRYLDRDAVQAGMASDWLNLGTNNDKRLYQLHLEHNTNSNVVRLHMDIRYGINGILQANSVAVFQIQSSEKTTVTLPIPEAGFPNTTTICKSIRLRPEYGNEQSSPETAPANTFRIFFKPTFDSETLPPDQVLFTPWTDMEWRWQKVAHVLYLDIDTGGVQALVQVQADGANIESPFPVTTTANDRSRNFPFTSLPFPAGKLWRLAITPGTGGKCQLFNWSLEKENYPPNQELFTPLKDFGYPCDKIAKVLNLDIDTGGVQVSVQVQADNTNIGAPFLITTTNTDRKRNLPFQSSPVQPIGKQWRLVNGAGSNDMVQLFDWSIDFQKEPCQITFFDTYELSFGYDGFKLAKQCWLEYVSAVPIIFTLLTDNAKTLFVLQLSAQANRNVVRFYLPQSNAPIIGTVSVSGANVTWLSGQQFIGPGWDGLSIVIGGATNVVSSVTDPTHLILAAPTVDQTYATYGIFVTGTAYALNKSTIYRIMVASTTAAGFKLYLETSRIEWAPLGAEQRGGVQADASFGSD